MILEMGKRDKANGIMVRESDGLVGWRCSHSQLVHRKNRLNSDLLLIIL